MNMKSYTKYDAFVSSHLHPMLLSRRASWIVSASAAPAGASTATAAANAANGAGVLPRDAPFPGAVLSPFLQSLVAPRNVPSFFFASFFGLFQLPTNTRLVVKLWWP